MAEYIDKEAFKKSAEERYCKPCKAAKKDYNGCRCRACWVDDMLDEIDCFHLSTLKLSYEEAVQEYEDRANTRLGKLVANRELPILYRAKEIIDDIESE